MAVSSLLIVSAFVGRVLASSEATLVDTWPWASICNKNYLPYNYTAGEGECLAFNRNELPIFNSSAEYDVLFLGKPVEGIPGGTRVSSLVGFTHTALGFRQRNGHEEFTLEYYALSLGTDVIIPYKFRGGFNWRDYAVMGWVPHIANTWSEKFLLGTANGSIVNDFMSWVPTWHNTHSSYELWSAWSDSELKAGVVRYFNETTCNTFVEDALWQLHKLGAPLSSTKTLCRNYFVLITKSLKQVASHGLRGSLRRFEMEAYYDSLGALRSKINGSHVPVFRWLEFAVTTMMEMLRPAAFLYEGPSGFYYFAELEKPIMRLNLKYLNQRMVLPWQHEEDARLGECGPWANVDVSSIVESVVV